MKPLSLEQAILSTISFFDTLSYPPTIAEIEEFLLFFPQDATAAQIWDCIESPSLRELIEAQNGMYYLKGRASIVRNRLARYVPAQKKYRIACRVARFLGVLPFIRMVCVVNSLAISNAQDESDIDFFIITRQKRIWFARLLVVAFLDFMRLRPDGRTKKDKICVCFFASEDALDFFDLQIPLTQDGIPDLYLAWWSSRFVPIYDAGGYAEKLFFANAWAKDIFPRRRLYSTLRERMVFPNFFMRSVKKMGEMFFGAFGTNLEKIARALQMRILPVQIRIHLNRDTRVVATERILKFHTRDLRSDIRTRFLKTCASYGIFFT